MNEPAPETLAAAGVLLWSKVVESYDLRADELATLEDACSITDMVAALTESWAGLGKPYTTKGSMGQEVIHPLIGEIRTQRMARNALWRQLKLPDDPAGAPANQARDAANASWQPGVRGRGA
jgi:DNA polymerase III psi subunit